MTAPFYTEIGSQKRRISKALAHFFLDWVQEAIRSIEGGTYPGKPDSQFIDGAPHAETRGTRRVPVSALYTLILAHRKPEVSHRRTTVRWILAWIIDT